MVDTPIMNDAEAIPKPRLANPVEDAEKFAAALVGIVRSQQKRLEVAALEIERLREQLIG